MEKLDYIKEHVSKKNFTFIPIENESSIKRIHNLLIKDKFEEPEHNVEYYYYGVYYRIKKDYETMKEYLFVSVWMGFSESMYILGYYYRNMNDYPNMIKYFEMASKKYHSEATNCLGRYYHNINKNKALEYYQLAYKYNKGNQYPPYNIGLIMSSKGDQKSAEEWFLKSLDLDPNYQNPYTRLVKYYKEKGDYSSLLDLYKRLNKNEDLVKTIIDVLEKNEEKLRDNEKNVVVYLTNIDLTQIKECPKWLHLLKDTYLKSKVFHTPS